MSPGIFEELFTSWKLGEESAVDLDSASFSARAGPADSPVLSDYGGYLEDDLKETGKKGMSVQVITLTNHGTIHLNDWF